MCCCRASFSARPMPTCGWCPTLLAIFVLAIRFKAETLFPLATWLALAAVGFMLVRLAGTTASMAIAGKRPGASSCRRSTHVPMGSRVAVLVWDKCEQWALRRSDHLGAIAIVRREAFTNDHWPMAGSSLLTVRYPAGRLVPARSVADRARSGLPPRGLAGRARRCAQSAARRVRLSVAGRHAADPARAGSTAGSRSGPAKGSILLRSVAAQRGRRSTATKRHAERHRHPADKRRAPARTRGPASC